MAPPAEDETTSTRGLLIGLALGLPLVAYGLRGMLVDAERTHPGELGRWIVGAAVVHDVLIVPVVLAVGLILRRLCPPKLWPSARWALFTSAVLTALAWPFIRGYGRRSSIPSLLPRNYAAGLLAALAAVWLTAALWALAGYLRRSRPHGHTA